MACPYPLITFFHSASPKIVMIIFQFVFCSFHFRSSNRWSFCIFFFIFFSFFVYVSKYPSLNCYAHFPNNPIQSMKTNFVFSNILRCFWFSFATFSDNTQQCLSMRFLTDVMTMESRKRYQNTHLNDSKTGDSYFGLLFFLDIFFFFSLSVLMKLFLSWAMNSEQRDTHRKKETRESELNRKAFCVLCQCY